MSEAIRKKLLTTTLIISILYSLFYSLPLYINSVILENFVDKKYISIIYSISGLFALYISLIFAKKIKKLHTYNTSIYTLLLGLLSTLALALTDNKYIFILGFVVYFICSTLFWFIINILTEEFTKKDTEGEVRGIFLTLLNTGIMIAPLISGQILSTFSYKIIYILAGLITLPMIYIMRNYYAHIQDPNYTKFNLQNNLKEISKHKNIFLIFLTNFILYSFYVIVTVYIPLYLKDYTNISLAKYAGIIMPIVLLPFVLLPYELGYLADKKYGEKEMIIIGITLMSLSVFLFPILNQNSILYITLILLLGRIGAAMLETMIHSYFYKNIPVEKLGLIILFNNTSTLTYIIVPLFVSIILKLVNANLSIVFIIFSLFSILSLFKIINIDNTR